MEKKKKKVFRVQPDGPRPPAGPFDTHGEALAYARNIVRVPEGKDAEKFLESRIIISTVKLTHQEQEDGYAPRKRRVMFDIPAMLTERMVAA